MNAIENEYFKMANTVNVTCIAYKLIWQQTPAFANAHGRLVAEVISVFPIALQQQSQHSMGITADKTTARRALEEDALTIANKVEAFAVVTKNNSLRYDVHATESSLRLTTDNALLGEVSRIAALATANLASLAPYQVTSGDIAAMQAKATVFISWLGKPQAAINNKKGGTQKLKAIKAVAQEIFEEMDGLMILFKQSDPEFYEQYFAGRALEEPSNHHRAISFLVVGVDGKPIPEVVIEVPALNCTKRTGPAGQCYIQTAPAAMYDCGIRKNGFLAQSMEIAVNEGERTDVRVVLVPR